MTSRTSALILCAPLPAILIGAWIAHMSGVSYAAYLPNLIAYAFGMSLILTRAFWLPLIYRYANLASSFVVLLLIASLFTKGLHGVHRWISIGPVSVNISMAFMPLILYGMALNPGIIALLLSLFTSILLFLQPDAGQLGVFAPAASAIFALEKANKPPIRIVGIATSFCLLIMTILRLDPLQPVEHVERILHLAYSQGLGFFVLALLSILLLLFPVLRSLSGKLDARQGILAQSLFAFLVMSFLVTEIRSCPVPVIGAGAGPVIGWFFATLLASSAKESK